MNKINNYKKFHEMLFIYNAVINGWTVKKVNNYKFKFTKEKKKLKILNLKDLNINQFVKDNLSMNTF
jgi:hypothetical protein